MGTKDFASFQVGVCHVAAAWYKGTITYNPLFTYTVHRPHMLHRDEVLFEFIFHFFQSSLSNRSISKCNPSLVTRLGT